MPPFAKATGGKPPALVLTAGLGTRLRPLTLVRAKPAVPIAGEPLVRRIITWLRAAGVSDLVLNLHHLPETIASVVGDGSDLGVRVRYSWEQPAVLGTAGGPRRALPLFGSGTFLIVNGDTLTDVDVPALIASHRPRTRSSRWRSSRTISRRNTAASSSTPSRESPASSGRGDRPRAPAYALSASARQAPTTSWVSRSRSRPRSTPWTGQRAGQLGGRRVRSAHRARPGAIRGFVTRATFWDIGTIADYWNTSAALGGPAPQGTNARVDPTARVETSILWDDVEIGARRVARRVHRHRRRGRSRGRAYRRAVLRGGPELIATPF